MDDEQIILYNPQDGETLKQYLRRYSPEDRLRIYQHKTKSKEFCTLLLNTKWDSASPEHTEESTERGVENLWKILQRLNNFRRLLHFIEMLEPVRNCLLASLDNYADEMNSLSKWCTTGRILGSTVDSAATLGGLYILSSKPSGENWALTVATLFGLLGLAFTISEMKLSSDVFDDLMKEIQIDQRHLSPIQEWYHQSSELEEEMANIFPFDFTNKIVQDFMTDGEKQQLNPVKLLLKLFTVIKEMFKKKESAKKEEKIDDVEVIENLITFVKCKEATELCLSLFLRRQHPISFDIARMLLQLKYSSYPYYICQSVAALSQRDRSGYSVPVMGRIGLNMFSICDGIRSLRRTKLRETEIRQLKKQLESELIALQKIANFIRLRSSGMLL